MHSLTSSAAPVIATALGLAWSLCVHADCHPSVVSEVMSVFCYIRSSVCVGPAIHVLLFIQYCPTPEHAKEGPGGQDEVIVEASAVAAFTTV